MTNPAMSPPAGIPALDPGDLLAAARRQVGIRDGTLRSWRWSSLWAPRLASTAGVYRTDWLIETGGEMRAGALVLKVLARSDRNVAPREAALYVSGVLDNLPNGLRAPRWFGNVNLGPDHVGVWLDLERDDPDVTWDVECFGFAARHLGRLAGTPQPSLNKQASQRPVRTFWSDADYAHKTLRAFSAEPGSSLVQRAWPDTIKRALLGLWEGRADMVARAGSLPVTLCHGDAQRRNLFVRRDSSGVATTAIDWANFGTAPVGMDIATLVYYAVAYFDVAADDITSLEEQGIQEYWRGFQELGMDIDVTTVWFGYAVQLVFGLGLLETGPVLRLATTPALHRSAEVFYGQSIDAILERRRILAEHLLNLASRMELGHP